MPDRKSNKKRPRDLNLLAANIVQAATEDEVREELHEYEGRTLMLWNSVAWVG